MYDISDAIPGGHIKPGTNLLVIGPPLAGKRELGLDIVAAMTGEGNGAIIVTTKNTSPRLLEELEERDIDPDSIPLGIVDCVSKQQGVHDVVDSDFVRYTSSPTDMTGIGIHFSTFIGEFVTDRQLSQNLVLLDSLSSLLMYSNLETVFRFLHVFTGRIQSTNALGLYLINASTHHEKTINTLKLLFDGLILVSDNGDVELVYDKF